MRPQPATPTALRRWTCLTAASTLFLIFAGAMVTSTGSGLAVPDWPLSYGKINPPMVGGIFYEHGHRVIAAAVGLLTLIQAVWLQRREPKRFLRILGWSSLGLVVIQGLFGGLTVLLLLPPAVSVTHAALAQLFLALNVGIAFFASGSYVSLRESAPGGLDNRIAAWILVGAIYVQILVGAIMRHLGVGLVIPDFPLSFGTIIPPLDSFPVAVAYSHRVMALAIALLIFWMVPRALRSGSKFESRTGLSLAFIVLMQIFLGAFTIWSTREPWVTSFHVLGGALLFAVSVAYALAAHAPIRRPSMVPAGMERSDVTA